MNWRKYCPRPARQILIDGTELEPPKICLTFITVQNEPAYIMRSTQCKDPLLSEYMNRKSSKFCSQKSSSFVGLALNLRFRITAYGLPYGDQTFLYMTIA